MTQGRGSGGAKPHLFSPAAQHFTAPGTWGGSTTPSFATSTYVICTQDYCHPVQQGGRLPQVPNPERFQNKLDAALHTGVQGAIAHGERD